MSLMRRVVLNSVSQTGGQAVMYLLGAAASIIAIRYLGPAEFGRYTLVLTYVGIIGAVADFGGQIVLVREINQQPERVRAILGNFLMVKAAYTVAVCGAGALVIGRLGYAADIRLYIMLGLLSVLLSVPATVGALFQARLQMWFWAGINIVGKIIALAAVLYMAASRGTIAVLLWANVAVAAVMSLLFWLLIMKHDPPSFRLDVPLVRRLVAETIPIGLLLIVGGLGVRAEMLLLSKLADDRSLGLYSAGYKFVDWGLMLINGLLISHLPLFAKFAFTEPDKVKRLYRVTFDLVAVLAIPLAVFGLVGSRPILVLFSGPAYAEGWGALTVLWWVILLNTWNALSINLLIAAKRTKQVLAVYSGALIAIIAANYVGIPRLGYAFCAAAAAGRELLTLVLLVLILRRSYHLVPQWRRPLLVLGNSLAAVVPVLLLGDRRLFVSLPLFLAAWLGFNFLFRAVRPDEVRVLWSRLRGSLA